MELEPQLKPHKENRPVSKVDEMSMISPQPEPISDAPQYSCSALLHDEAFETPEQQPTPLPPAPEPTPCFNWAEDAETLLIVMKASPPPP